ncbi:MAG TPA: hypothetical protein VK559_07205 [Ferruginibacter sp.]|nr:hypothetical protein [Ferruginibacter sp.]
MINAIQIPKPCHEDWNAMTINEQGRHCLQCCKNVVDFTAKEPEEILQYLKENTTKRVCGRFRSAQVDTPVIPNEELTFHIFNSSLSYFKKIAALILITFGIVLTSADKTFSQTTKTDSTKKIEQPNTVPVSPVMMGDVEYLPVHKPATTKKKVKKTKCHAKKAPSDSANIMLMGMVEAPDQNQ